MVYSQNIAPIYRGRNQAVSRHWGWSDPLLQHPASNWRRIERKGIDKLHNEAHRLHKDKLSLSEDYRRRRN